MARCGGLPTPREETLESRGVLRKRGTDGPLSKTVIPLFHLEALLLPQRLLAFAYLGPKAVQVSQQQLRGKSGLSPVGHSHSFAGEGWTCAPP